MAQDPKDKLTRQPMPSLAALPAKQRLDALIDFPDAKLAVRRVPAEDLYLAIAEVGLDDATDIVQLASPTQFRTFVDLAGWKRDRLVPKDVLTWLRAARGDEGEDFLSKVNKLDLEVLEYLLRELVVIYDLEEDPDANPEGVTFEMPEGRYLLELKAEGAELAALRQLINDLVAQDPFQAGRLFEAIRWEVPSELEETAFQFRSARLQDLGFPELYEALSIFAFTDPDKLAPPPAPATDRTGLAAAREAPNRFLESCFRDLTPEERPYHEEQLRYLINAALVAEGAEPGDPEAIRKISELARDHLALGLEHATGGDPDQAADAVRRLGFRRIFQAGFSLTLRLKFRADRMARSGAVVDGMALMLPDEERVFSAVRRKRPLRALKVEGAEPVPFRRLRELHEAAEALEHGEHQQAVFRALLGEDTHAREALNTFGPDELTAADVWLATVARASIALTPQIAPFPEARLSDFGAAMLSAKPEDAEKKVFDVLGKQVAPASHAELSRMIAWAGQRFRDELGAAFKRDGTLGPEAGAVLPIA